MLYGLIDFFSIDSIWKLGTEDVLLLLTEKISDQQKQIEKLKLESASYALSFHEISKDLDRIRGSLQKVENPDYDD